MEQDLLQYIQPFLKALPLSLVSGCAAAYEEFINFGIYFVGVLSW
jgi:hypothetical protein